MSDNYYIQGVKAGDVHQLEPLYQKYRQELMGYFFRRTSGKDSLSQDLVQQVFMRIIKYRHTYKDGAAFRPWMYQLARNVFIDEYRSWQPLANASTLQQQEYVDPEPSTHTRLEQQEAVYFLQKALQQLPAESQQLIDLCKYQALPYRKVAQILNISEGNVKVRLHRSIKALSKVYLQLNPQNKEA